jgi:hypothetical protein
MKYWAFLSGKLAAAVLVLYYAWHGLKRLLPSPRPFLNIGQPFGHDLSWTLAAGLHFVLGCGLIYLCILDQRYRCRVCLRRLRMPVETGSWGQMLLLGRPRIEYICPFGHGTLEVSEIQISGFEPPGWKAHEDMWTELTSLEKSQK